MVWHYEASPYDRGGVNPTALRKAKIVYNFGLSECNRCCGTMEQVHVTEMALTLLHSERPKLYTILAFLNATGVVALWSKSV